MYQQPFYPVTNKLLQDCAMYDLLANYYKYLDPQRHMYYYQLHFMCMQQLCRPQHVQQPMMPMYAQDFRSPTQEAQPAVVRAFHASPDAPAVDIYVNGKKTFRNMTYYQISKPAELPAGSYQIDVYPAGQTTNPVLSQTVSVEAGQHYIVAAVGQLKNLRLQAITDPQDIQNNRANVRFWHLSPNAPAVDIAVPGGAVLFRNISFGKVTNFLELAPGMADLEVRIAGTNDVVLTLRGLNLKANEAYTIVAMGLVGGTPRLEALVLK